MQGSTDVDDDDSDEPFPVTSVPLPEDCVKGLYRRKLLKQKNSYALEPPNPTACSCCPALALLIVCAVALRLAVLLTLPSSLFSSTALSQEQVKLLGGTTVSIRVCAAVCAVSVRVQSSILAVVYDCQSVCNTASCRICPLHDYVLTIFTLSLL